MPDLKKFLEKWKIKQMKKSDWIVIALAGVLLLVIMLPSGGGTEKSEEKPAAADKEDALSDAESDKSRSYVSNLEKKLENTLKRIDGVGDVKVMITIADNGENVVEKDSGRVTSTTSEEDSAGGVRSASESSINSSTVFVEEDGGQYPYVQKELLPVIRGVVIVAEGGGDTYVKTEITEAVLALFPVEAHRIKVLAMTAK